MSTSGAGRQYADDYGQDDGTARVLSAVRAGVDAGAQRVLANPERSGVKKGVPVDGVDCHKHCAHQGQTS